MTAMEKPSPFRQTKIAVKFLTLVAPPNWNPQTLLARAITKSGDEYLVRACGNAYAAFAALRTDTSYEMVVRPACVKSSDAPRKNGVDTRMELSFKYPPALELSKESFPTNLAWTIKSFADLSQMQHGDWCNIHGIVLAVEEPTDRQIKTSDASYSIRTVRVKLGKDDYHVYVEFSGHLANYPFQVADVLAVRGVTVREYNQQRQFQSGFCTLVCSNPPSSEDLPRLTPLTSDSPTKKAGGVKNLMPLDIRSLHAEAETLLYQVNSGTVEKKTKREAAVLGCFVEFEHSLLERAYPFYGEEGSQRIRLKIDVRDSSGTLTNVTLWHDAATTLLHIDVQTLQSLWEKCDDEDGIDALLSKLNHFKDKPHLFLLTYCVWQPQGGNAPKAVIQYEINAVEAREVVRQESAA